MEEQSAGQKAADAVAAALQKKLEQDGHLENVLKAFGKTLIEQARWKADLNGYDNFEGCTPNAELFAKGIPVCDREQLIQLGELWTTAAHHIIPGLQEGFPLLHDGLARLWTTIVDGSFSPDFFMSAVCGGRAGEARATAGQIGFEPELLVFVLTQLAKPVLARRSELLMSQVGDLSWNRGYCPICGSFPEMSLLKGKEGQRWLRCGFCSASWRFSRLTCPFCDSQEGDGIELLFVEGREHERVEVCNKCKRYITGIDLREGADEAVQEVLNLSLVHLEAVAQKKGFLPMKGSGWEIPGSTGGSIA
ncbi:MAG: formate dehydrogenase accessory protein FdhE [Syntrophobacteraceae bacterium]